MSAANRDHKENKDSKDRQAEIEQIKLHFRLAGSAVMVILGIGVVFYHLVEKLSWVDSFYFCVVSLTTVGYGDIAPVTTAGKLFTAFYLMAGIGLLATFANLGIKRAYIARRENNK